MIEEERCPHCGAELGGEKPRVCPQCGGSLQRRYLRAGCLSSKPVGLLLVCALLAGADGCREGDERTRTVELLGEP
ncbi:MAG: hypothetical protein CMJ84_01135 [Planctomycetes bacterium]|nr:hypothetical protein [Planctomycetota bacterium]